MLRESKAPRACKVQSVLPAPQDYRESLVLRVCRVFQGIWGPLALTALLVRSAKLVLRESRVFKE